MGDIPHGAFLEGRDCRYEVAVDVVPVVGGGDKQPWIGKEDPKREAVLKSWWDCKKWRRVAGFMSRVGNGKGEPWWVVSPMWSASVVGGGSGAGRAL